MEINRLKLAILAEAVKNGHVCGKFISAEYSQDINKVSEIIRQLCIDGFLCKHLIVDNGIDICGEPNGKSYETVEHPSILLSKEGIFEIYNNSNVIKGSFIQESEINVPNSMRELPKIQPQQNQKNELIYKILKYGIFLIIWALIEIFTEYGIIQKFFNRE